MSINGLVDENCRNIIIKIILLGSNGVGKKSFIKKVNNIKCNKSTPFNHPELKDKCSNILAYNFSDVKISFIFFMPSLPEKYLGEENEISSSDEDEEIREKYYIKFTSMKKDIKQFLTLFSNMNNVFVLNVFAFFYDLSDFETSIDELFLIFQSINKKFKIKENFNIVFFGTKIDKKKKAKNQIKQDFDEFLTNNPKIKSYEIGTRINFDFVKFFSNFVKYLLNEEGSSSENIIDQICKKIEEKQGFSKAPKYEKEQISISPGPAKYLNNIYDTENIQERINALIGENRFNTKLFINKKGPQLYKERTTEKKDDDPFNKFRNQYELEKRKKLQEIAEYLVGSKKGYSFDGAGHNLSSGGNLLAERKKKADERNELYYSAFRDNIIYGKPKLQKNLRYDSSKTLNNSDDKIDNNQIYNSPIRKSDNNQERFKTIVQENKSRIFQDEIDKKQLIMDKFQIKYDKEERNKMRERYKDILYGKNSLQLKKTDEKIEELKIKKEQEKNKEETHMYDISRGLLNEKKGFTMLSRRIPVKKEINEAPYVYIKSDFDKCVEKYKNDGNKNSSGKNINKNQ